jgi:hypothetical protein
MQLSGQQEQGFGAQVDLAGFPLNARAQSIFYADTLGKVCALSAPNWQNCGIRMQLSQAWICGEARARR